MKNLIIKYAHKFYITSKIAAKLYPNEFVWLNERHLLELNIKLGSN